MKKKILLALFLALIPTYGWGKCKGPTIACPEDRPYFIGKRLSEYFYPQQLQFIDDFNELEEAWSQEIPDFQFEEECKKTQDPVCQKLDEVKFYQEEFKKWDVLDTKEKVNQENERIRKRNEIIESKRQMIRYKNDLYAIYRSMIDVNAFARFCTESFGLLPPNRFVVAGVQSDDINPKTSLQKAVKDYIEEINAIRSNNLSKVDYNKRAYERNKEIEKRNADIERKNAEIEKQFLAFYTPEKTEQLIKDYEKAIAEQCVGCDYPEPLAVSEYDCQKCPERIFVDDKCVLRESYFKNKKGVKK